MDLKWLFELLNNTGISQSLQASRYALAISEGLHLLSLTLLGGVLLVENGRALWPRLTPGSRLAGPYRIALVSILSSGFLLVAAEPMKCYAHPAFRAKMLVLAAGLLLQPWLSRMVFNQPRSWPAKLGATLSLLLWTSVGFFGRAIGFY